MPKRLKRIYGFGHLHFITFSCYRRLPLLGSAHARNVFVQILGEVREQFGFALVGFVVMLEHVHLLIGEPKKGKSVDGAVRFKAARLDALASSEAETFASVPACAEFS